MFDYRTLIEAKNIFESITEGIDPSSLYDKDGYIPYCNIYNCFKSNEGITINHGSTRYAIIIDGVPFVYKINKKRTGTYNYCKLEADTYSNAKTEGYECYFAQMEYLLSFGDIEVYVQEKVDVFDQGEYIFSCEGDYSDEHYNLIEEISKSYCSGDCIPLDWMADFTAYYSDAELDDFFYFLDNHNINDLHDSNIGYIGTRPVVFDYSGWYG